ncbi:MAG: hypothetical protein WDW38_004051 [Sanguina aurantia]
MSEASICDNNPLISYSNRVDNPDGYNWCLVPDGGADAVFFAGVAIVAMCLANPRWDALITLVAGAVYEVFAFKFNLGHVSNAVSLWLGMRPSDIFVYVFFPPFLLDLASRIDFYMLKKTMVSVLMMAFVMVVASALLLIPLMLYGLDLQSRGWTAAHVALFGAMIASTDAASVSAALRSGGGPEILSVLLEGESLLNDASSLTLFEIFSKIVANSENVSLSHELSNITVDILYASVTALGIGMGMGLFNKYVFLWLQHRNIPPQAEVAFTVAGSYLCYYITQVWCGGSGVIAVVVYGLYGSSTLTWGISSRARLEGTFKQFWVVLVFMINGLIFFYVGAAAVNFTWRASDTLFTDKTQGLELVLIVFYKLPIIYLASFAMRLAFISVSFTVLKWMHLSDGLTWQEMVFVTVGGLRGSLSLVLAEAVSTAASAGTDKRVKAEIAIFTTGYVMLTLLINQPLCGPLLTVLGLNKVKQEQLHMRHQVKSMFLKYTTTTIEDLKADQEEDEMLQGVDWTVVEGHTDFTKELDLTLPSAQPSVPTYSTMRERLCGWNQLAGRTLASLHRRLRSCCTSPGRDATRNETAEEAQGRLKSAAILNRTTRQSMSLMLASPSRRSVMWPGGGGFEAEAVLAEPNKARGMRRSATMLPARTPPAKA